MNFDVDVERAKSLLSGRAEEWNGIEWIPDYVLRTVIDR